MKVRHRLRACAAPSRILQTVLLNTSHSTDHNQGDTNRPAGGSNPGTGGSIQARRTYPPDPPGPLRPGTTCRTAARRAGLLPQAAATTAVLSTMVASPMCGRSCLARLARRWCAGKREQARCLWTSERALLAAGTRQSRTSTRSSFTRAAAAASVPARARRARGAAQMQQRRADKSASSAATTRPWRSRQVTAAAGRASRAGGSKARAQAAGRRAGAPQIHREDTALEDGALGAPHGDACGSRARANNVSHVS